MILNKLLLLIFCFVFIGCETIDNFRDYAFRKTQEWNKTVGEQVAIFEDGNLPWDKEHRYSKSNCKLFLKCSKIHPITKIEESFYYPIRNDESLLKVLTCKKVHMNGFPIICVVSPMSFNYYEHFLKKNNIKKRNVIYSKKYNKK